MMIYLFLRIFDGKNLLRHYIFVHKRKVISTKTNKFYVEQIFVRVGGGGHKGICTLSLQNHSHPHYQWAENLKIILHEYNSFKKRFSIYLLK